MPRITGCTADGIDNTYTACVDCEHKNYPVSCVGRRNRGDAVEQME